MTSMPAEMLSRAAIAAICVGMLAGCVSSSNPLRAVGAPVVTPTQQVEELAARTAADKSKLQQGIALNVGEDTGRKSAVPAVVPDAPQMAKTREGSVEQIRAKAALTGNAPPDVFAGGQRATTGMSSAEQEKSRAELEAMAAKNAAMVSGSDAAAKAKKLKLQAKSHYEETLKEIEN